jgi:hypothetical protein
VFNESENNPGYGAETIGGDGSRVQTLQPLEIRPET